jgi:hypothetical protein
MSVSEKNDPLGPTVFVDIDGVFHPDAAMYHARRGIYMCPVEAPGHVLFEWLHILEEALRPYPQVRLVLSSSWCIRPGYSATLKRFPAKLRERFVGGTFHWRYHGANAGEMEKFLDMPRGMQIWQDVERRQPLNWLAIDDNAEGWPDWALDNLIRCDGSTGLSSQRVQDELNEKLCGFTGYGALTRDRTEQQLKMVKLVSESPHFTPDGVRRSIHAAPKKAGR